MDIAAKLDGLMVNETRQQEQDPHEMPENGNEVDVDLHEPAQRDNQEGGAALLPQQVMAENREHVHRDLLKTADAVELQTGEPHDDCPDLHGSALCPDVSSSGTVDSADVVLDTTAHIASAIHSVDDDDTLDSTVLTGTGEECEVVLEAVAAPVFGEREVKVEEGSVHQNDDSDDPLVSVSISNETNQSADVVEEEIEDQSFSALSKQQTGFNSLDLDDSRDPSESVAPPDSIGAASDSRDSRDSPVVDLLDQDEEEPEPMSVESAEAHTDEEEGRVLEAPEQIALVDSSVEDIAPDDGVIFTTNSEDETVAVEEEVEVPKDACETLGGDGMGDCETLGGDGMDNDQDQLECSIDVVEGCTRADENDDESDMAEPVVIDQESDAANADNNSGVESCGVGVAEDSTHERSDGEKESSADGAEQQLVIDSVGHVEGREETADDIGQATENSADDRRSNQDPEDRTDNIFDALYRRMHRPSNSAAYVQTAKMMPQTPRFPLLSSAPPDERQLVEERRPIARTAGHHRVQAPPSVYAPIAPVVPMHLPAANGVRYLPATAFAMRHPPPPIGHHIPAHRPPSYREILPRPSPATTEHSTPPRSEQPPPLASPTANDANLVKLLETPQPGPRHVFVPPPPELGILAPPQGYVCRDCGETYALKSSLEFHLQRRCMSIHATCQVCRKPYVFYNRCAYLQHIRKHVESFAGALPAHISAKTIMRGLTVASVTAEDFDKWFEDTAYQRFLDIDVLLDYELAAGEAYVASKQQRAASNNKQMERGEECTECCQSLPPDTTLRDHFAYNLPPNQKQLICHLCQAVYFSQCSYQAHRRGHECARPCTCAECGVVLPSSNDLTRHVMEHRSEPTVLDAFRCARCNTFYSSLDALMLHISGVHCESYYKCEWCPMAFSAQDVYVDHLRREHPNSSTLTSNIHAIMKCLECSKVFPSRDELVTHLSFAHKQVLVKPFCVYRCPICGRLMENKTGLVAHLRTQHRIVLDLSMIKEMRIKIPDEPSGVAEPSADDSMKKCRACMKLFADHAALLRHGRQHLGSTEIVCLLCDNQPFPDRPALEQHLSTGHTATACERHCTEEFDTREGALQHARQIHQIPSLQCAACHQSFTSAAQLTTHSTVCPTGQAMMRDAGANIAVVPGSKQPIGAVAPRFTTAHRPPYPQHRQHPVTPNVTVKPSCSSPKLATGFKAMSSKPSATPNVTATVSPRTASMPRLQTAMRCPACSYTSSSAESWVIHLTDRHPTLPPSRLPCPLCGDLTAESHSSVSYHLTAVHRITKMSELNSLLEQSVRLRNLRLGRIAKRRRDMTQHAAAAWPDSAGPRAKASKLVCEVCTAEFGSEVGFLAHIKTHGLRYLQLYQQRKQHKR